MARTQLDSIQLERFDELAKNLSRCLEIDHASFADMELKVTSHGFQVGIEIDSPLVLTLMLETNDGKWWWSTSEHFSFDHSTIEVIIFSTEGYIVATGATLLNYTQPRRKFLIQLTFFKSGEISLLQGTRAFVHIDKPAPYKTSTHWTQDEVSAFDESEEMDVSSTEESPS